MYYGVLDRFLSPFHLGVLAVLPEFLFISFLLAAVKSSGWWISSNSLATVLGQKWYEIQPECVVWDVDNLLILSSLQRGKMWLRLNILKCLFVAVGQTFPLKRDPGQAKQLCPLLS